MLYRLSLRTKFLLWKRKSPRAQTAAARSRRFVPLSIPLSSGPPMCCGHPNHYGGGLPCESQTRLASHRYFHHHNYRLNRNGKKWRLASLANCSRPTRRNTVSACWYGSRREPTIRLTAMPEPKNCICFTVRSGSMTRSLYPGDYIRAEADSVDHRVWSETDCTCVLLTSTRDVIL